MNTLTLRVWELREALERYDQDADVLVHTRLEDNGDDVVRAIADLNLETNYGQRELIIYTSEIPGR